MEDKERRNLMPKFLPTLGCFLGGICLVSTIAFTLNNATGFYWVCGLLSLLFSATIAIRAIIKKIKQVNTIG